MVRNKAEKREKLQFALSEFAKYEECDLPNWRSHITKEVQNGGDVDGARQSVARSTNSQLYQCDSVESYKVVQPYSAHVEIV